MKKYCFFAVLFLSSKLFCASFDIQSLHTEVVCRHGDVATYTYPVRELMMAREKRALVRGGINLHDKVRHFESSVEGKISGSGPGVRFVVFVDGRSDWVDLDLLERVGKK